MEAQIKQLFDILNRQTLVYESILKLSKQKTDLIVAGKIKELENLVKLEQALVLQISRLEKQREETSEELSSQLALQEDQNKISITNLLNHLNDEQQEQLKSFQQKMKEIVEELKNTNELNAKLIKQSLEYIEFSMNMITGTSVSGTQYEDKGTTKDSKGTRNLFDIKL